MKLSVIGCYALAWRSFSKWWIPLCLISGILIVFQVVPRLLVRADVSELTATASSFMTAVSENDLNLLEEMSSEMLARTVMLMRKVMGFGLCLFPLVTLLTVILLMYANWAAKNRQGEWKSLATLTYIAVVHVVLAFVKLAAFLLFFIPGAYLYIKLLFVSLIMLEEKRGAWAAMRISWRMTDGNYWRLFLLVFVNTGVQMLALPTLIGEIPVTGFVNTARAAAFRMLWEEERGKRGTMSDEVGREREDPCSALRATQGK